LRRIKLVLAALAVAAASFMALSGPAMAVECNHTNERGVIECGKKDNVFLSEDRFFDNNPDCFSFRCDFDELGFLVPAVPVFATDVDELGCWEWSWVFERWEWEDDCD
jgi:hypothetical protein